MSSAVESSSFKPAGGKSNGSNIFTSSPSQSIGNIGQSHGNIVQKTNLNYKDDQAVQNLVRSSSITAVVKQELPDTCAEDRSKSTAEEVVNLVLNSKTKPSILDYRNKGGAITTNGGSRGISPTSEEEDAGTTFAIEIKQENLSADEANSASPAPSTSLCRPVPTNPSSSSSFNQINNPLQLLSSVAATVQPSSTTTAGVTFKPSGSTSAVSSSTILDSNPALPLTPAEVARNLMLASEMSANRILRMASQDPSILSVGSADLSLSSACSLHPDGKASGVECPKCDVVLGSSRSLGGHMTMMHSRNSCKTLKCPKCNWHYKYQETLEIHMKEKHPDTEVTCVYCLTNQAHPRLARGETYSCGYKPYRCDICKYSTTTKGNLSIHMQSDKHLNNVQEIQHGKVVADPTAVVSNIPSSSNRSPAIVGTVSSSCIANVQSTTSSSVSVITAPHSSSVSTPVPSTKAKPSWRCEICNYETNVARNLRIHWTSEKHHHNMMMLQQNVKHLHQQGFAPTALPGGYPTGTAVAPLPISTSSNSPFAQAAPAGSTGSTPALDAFVAATSLLNPEDQSVFLNSSIQNTIFSPISEESKLFFCCVCANFSCNTMEEVIAHVQMDRSNPQESDVSVISGYYICNLCSYKTHLKANFQLHTKTDKHLQRLQLVNHIREGGQRNEWRIQYLTVSNTVQLRCNSCNDFSSSLHKLDIHCSTLRHELFAHAFLAVQEQKLPSDNHFYFCSLCSYASQQRINVLGHLHSAHHSESVAKAMQIAASTNTDAFSDGNIQSSLESMLCREWIEIRDLRDQPDGSIELDNRGDGSEVANNSELIKKESVSEEEQSISGTPAPSIEEGNEDAAYVCAFCDFTTASKSTLADHTSKVHDQNQDQRGASNNAKESSKSSLVTSYTCPLCQSDFGEGEALLRTHLAEVHSVSEEVIDRLTMLLPATPIAKPTRYPIDYSDSSSKVSSIDGPKNGGIAPKLEFSCPICASLFSNLDALFMHQEETGHLEIKQSPAGTSYLCWQKGCNQYFKSTTSLQTHFKEIHAKRTEPLSSTSSPGPSLLTTSDRHAFKYRCTQCSLAFRTEEKLKYHHQYHLMRAATKCAICGRNFRSIDGLKKHIESTHPNLFASSLQQYKDQILNSPSRPNISDLNGHISAADLSRTSSGGSRSPDTPDIADDEPLDEESAKSLAAAEGNYQDPSRKFKCHRCKVAYTRQSYLAAHNKTLLHRRGEKPVGHLDKYLDPSRPYKCETCRESFTQKNILFVHNNSVSHLHTCKKLGIPVSTENPSVGSQGHSQIKVEPELLNPSASSFSPVTSRQPTSTASVSREEKPYRCNVCKVAYTQSSTLDIHTRSVGHQSRMSKLPELIASGEVDANKSYIETPELRAQMASMELLTGVDRPNLETAIQSAMNMNTLPTSMDLVQQQSAALMSLASMTLAPFFGTFPGPTGFMPPLIGVQNMGTPFPCNHCKMPFATKEMADFHQKSCPNAVKPTTGTDQPQSTSGDIPFSGKNSANLSASHVNTNHKGVVYRRLLENYGFELVMQYNELHQRKRPKAIPPASSIEDEKENQFSSANPTDSDAPTAKRPKTATTEIKASVSEENKSDSKQENKFDPTGNDILTEKHACQECGREFSGVWVLKAHIEHVHKTCMPTDLVELASVEIKEAYEKKHKTDDAGEQIQIMDTGDVASSAPSSQTPVVAIVESAPSGSVSVSEVPSSDTLKVPKSTEIPSTSTIPSIPSNLSLSTSVSQQQAMAQSHVEALASMSGLNPAAFSFMGLPFNPFAFQSPFMPMMLPTTLDPLTFAASFGMTAPPVSSSQLSNAVSLEQQHLSTTTPTASPAVTPSKNSSLSAAILNAAAQAVNNAAAAQAPLQNAQNKRARTRITDDQLKVLREYFDINNSPTEAQVEEMARKSGLPQKVIKHWFRNTLFKERQRNKDSPYNFSVPPSLGIDLEQYEKTGEAKIIPYKPNGEPMLEERSEANDLEPTKVKTEPDEKLNTIVEEDMEEQMNTAVDLSGTHKDLSLSLPEESHIPPTDQLERPIKTETQDTIDSVIEETINRPPPSNSSDISGTASGMASKEIKKESPEITKPALDAQLTPLPLNLGAQTLAFNTLNAEEALRHLNVLPPVQVSGYSTASGLGGLNPFATLLSPSAPKPSNSLSPQSASSGGSNNSDNLTSFLSNAISPAGGSCQLGRRANRTRFTDEQIKSLQEFFEQNAYPKDDDLELLSKRLSLSPRVIVVWFQNARQKARKMYENQPLGCEGIDPGSESMLRTPGQNYKCERCDLTFQRYCELIKHKQNVCYKNDSWTKAEMDQDLDGRISIADTEGLENFRCSTCGLDFDSVAQVEEHRKTHPNVLLGAYSSGSKNNQSSSGQEGSGSDSNPGSPSGMNSKRQRTQILPEQLDYLYEMYSLDANPSSKHLDEISMQTGLSKRVVQVWFQNTRARDRKGQLVNSGHTIHFNKRCPCCGILFHSKTTMESHLSSRHAEQIAQRPVNVETLPNAEEVPTITNISGSTSSTTVADPTTTSATLAQSLANFGLIPTTTGSLNSGLSSDALKKMAEMQQKIPPSQNPTSAGIGEWLAKMVAGNAEGTSDEAIRISQQQTENAKSIISVGAQLHSSSSSLMNDDCLSQPDSENFIDEDTQSSFSHDSPPASSVTGSSGIHVGNNRQFLSHQKRFRTHLSPLQIKVMKQIFQHYKTPTMAECELLGQELIGLHKRVVQVWFQNARAKERKSKLGISGTMTQGGDMLVTRPTPTGCNFCDIKYTPKHTVQDHVFSRNHIQRVRSYLMEKEGMKDSPKPSVNPAALERLHLSGMIEEKPSSKTVTMSSASPAEHTTELSAFKKTGSSMPATTAPQVSLGSTVLQTATQQAIVNPLMYHPGGVGGIPAAYYASALMYPGALSGLPGFYDPNLHGTLVNMLQIPTSVMQTISEALQDNARPSVRFTQDGRSLADLKSLLTPEREASNVTEIDLEVGWACRPCQTVFPNETLFQNHQRVICNTISPAFVLIQTHYNCNLCKVKYGTVDEYLTHNSSAEHLAKVTPAAKQNDSSGAAADNGNKVNN